MARFSRWMVVLALLVAFPTTLLGATLAENSGDGAKYDAAVSKAVAFLEQAQADDGSFSKQTGPAVTSLVIASILKHGRSVDDPVVAKGLKYILSFAQDDGGIYLAESNYKNYETCISIMCLAEANKDGRYDEVLKKAQAFVKELQWDEGEGHDISSTSYGGAGYGSHRRPDLSNTSFMIDALRAAGTEENDPALQRALAFVSRCQNLESAHNTTEFAAKVNDGGFYYTIAAGGSSQAGPADNGGLRSYGSMTYAGLKSMIFAGVGKDDQRVKAALAWLSKHYTLAENPGMGDNGLYYYYHTCAKALDAVGEVDFKDGSGKARNWKQELTQTLVSKQQENGSWINSNPRWMENDPNLVTGYALLTLAYCR